MHVRERAHSATMPDSAREVERGREEGGMEGGGERFSVKDVRHSGCARITASIITP